LIRFNVVYSFSGKGESMVLYVREMTAEEEVELRTWAIGEDSELKHRAQLVLLSRDGYRIPEIGPQLVAHPANLRKWIHRFNTEGCKGLVTKRSGGPKPRFTDEQRDQIIALAQARPRELGLPFTRWTLHRLAEQAQKRGIVDEISHERVRQILLSVDCQYK
jgi:transposase